MNVIIKFFCCLLILGVGGLFIFKKPDGTPWLTIHDLKPNVSLDLVKDAINDATPNKGTTTNTVSVYRWRDAEGNWQFSDTPPTDQNAEQLNVDTDLNKDLAVAPKTLPNKEANQGGKTHLIDDGSVKDSLLPSPTTVPLDQITGLLEDAKNIQTLMDERANQLEALQ